MDLGKKRGLILFSRKKANKILKKKPLFEWVGGVLGSSLLTSPFFLDFYINNPSSFTQATYQLSEKMSNTKALSTQTAKFLKVKTSFTLTDLTYPYDFNFSTRTLTYRAIFFFAFYTISIIHSLVFSKTLHDTHPAFLTILPLPLWQRLIFNCFFSN